MDRPDSEDFETLALDLFRYQWESNPTYRGLLEAEGFNPSTVTGWKLIPSVSTTAFKRLIFTCGHPTLVFRTSGTSGGPGRRGEHHLVDAELYRASLVRSFQRLVLPEQLAGGVAYDGDARCLNPAGMRLVIVAPMPAWAPDSSLGFMMKTLLDVLGSPGSIEGLGPGGLHLSALIETFSDSEDSGVPLALLGTSSALNGLMDRLRAGGHSYRLPDDSRIMDTGGSKGMHGHLSRSEQLDRYAATFGISATRVVNEYGMTEMASQFYDGSLLGLDPEVKLGPHWVRTRIVDPRTGVDAEPGEPGILVHLDLANMDSVAAIETEDLGVARGDGFVLLGRTAGSEPRGCSLAAEALLRGGGSS